MAACDLAGSGADLILASDLWRAVETALPIAARLGLPIRLEPRLRERLLGTAEGRPADQVDPADLGVTGRHVMDPDARPPGGESVRQLYDRVTSLLRDLLHGDLLLGSTPGRRLILVTHGGPIRVAGAYLAGLGPAEMTWTTVPNGSIVAVSPRRRTDVPVSRRCARKTLQESQSFLHESCTSSSGALDGSWMSGGQHQCHDDAIHLRPERS